MQKIKIIILVFFVPIILSGCSSTYYAEYKGKDAVRKAGDGVSEISNGVEIWSAEGPPVRYKVIGVMTDTRNGGLIPLAMLNSAVASKVKEVGGDAAIQMNQSKKTRYRNYTQFAVAGNTPYSYNGVSSVTKVTSDYMIIKYLDKK
jgi:hypothetical protein